MKAAVRICLIALNFVFTVSVAQQVPKTVLAEHFTNTWCSICASRNPGLFANLVNYPQVLHISYYPSAPYAGCPLSMYNVPEQDARTHFYGIYGGTPQLVVNGAVISSVFTDPAIYTSQFSKTTSFDLKISLQPSGPDSVTARVVVKKVDTSSLTALQLYSAVVEDTLFFTANNGEPRHYDVFRKALWGSSPLSITAPASPGDSVVYSKTIAVDGAWVRHRVYALAVLQQANKELVQAAKSAHSLMSTGSPVVCMADAICVYPNPASDKLFLGGMLFEGTARITDSKGALRKSFAISKQDQYIDISTLAAGLYFLILNDDQHLVYKRFFKN